MADYPGATYPARTVAELQALFLGGGSPTHAEYDIEVADEVEAVETDLRAAIADGGAATTIQARLLEMDAATTAAVSGAAAALATHDADTTNVHGIANTASLATGTDVSNAVATHDADTTNVHGIADTSTLYRSGGTDVAVADGGTGASTAADARTNLGLGTIAVQDANNVAITGGAISGITDLAVADGGTGASDASGARTNLGLGTIATQAANNVSITGGSISGITDLAVADGGTGASTAANARTNLGLGTIATQDANNVAITGGSVTGITDIAVADGGTGSSTAAGARTNLGLGTIATEPETSYALLAGRAGGQVLVGGTAAGDDLTLEATANATPGTIFVGASDDADQVQIRSDTVVIGVPAAVAGTAIVSLEGVGANEILELRTPATNDDVVEYVKQSRAATTNATITSLQTITVPTDVTMIAFTLIVARRTGGSAGTAGDGAAYARYAAVKDIGGTLTQIGTTATPFTAEDQAGWDATIDVSGNTLRVRVTGAANNNVTWHCTTRYSYVST